MILGAIGPGGLAREAAQEDPVRSLRVTRRYYLHGERVRPLPGSLESSFEECGLLNVAVLTTVCQSGADTGTVLTNRTAEERSFTTSFAPVLQPPCTGSTVFRNRNGVREPVLEFEDAFELTVDVPPRRTLLYEVPGPSGACSPEVPGGPAQPPSSMSAARSVIACSKASSPVPRWRIRPPGPTTTACGQVRTL